MNAWLTTITSQFAALNTRERWMVFAAGLAVIYFGVDTALLGPVTKQHTGLRTEVTQSQQQLADMQQQLTTLEHTPVVDVDLGNKAKIATLNASIAAQSQALAALNNTLVSPALMPQLLENLMQRHANIRLVSMQTLPPVDFIRATAHSAAPSDAINANLTPNAGQNSNPNSNPNSSLGTMHVRADAQPTVYQHGLILTLSGRYMDLLQYAEALQGLSAQVLWDKAELTAKDYPLSELTVTVYTLSLDATWLSI
jgi:MSHA biogenesis protein MshJ